jgi:hypothetical protein
VSTGKHSRRWARTVKCWTDWKGRYGDVLHKNDENWFECDRRSAYLFLPRLFVGIVVHDDAFVRDGAGGQRYRLGGVRTGRRRGGRPIRGRAAANATIRGGAQPWKTCIQTCMLEMMGYHVSTTWVRHVSKTRKMMHSYASQSRDRGLYLAHSQVQGVISR